LHAHRVRWRIAAARLASLAQAARVAAGDASCTDADIAKRWGLRSDRGVARFFDPESGKAIAFGDVLALPPELARDILTRALAALDENVTTESVERLALRLGHAMGVLMDDLAHDKHARNADSFARIAAIALRGHLAAIRKAAAAEGGR
jgi:hypothetical protein